MKIHIICEGPTDNEILERIIQLVLESDIEFIKPSNTQRKNRGVSSISTSRILFKFLHYSYQYRADCIIICRDNDENEINHDGIPQEFHRVREMYEDFSTQYSESYSHNPIEIITIPVETIDYWMLAGLMKEAGPGTVRGIENSPKNSIKCRVYGEDNLNPINAPYEEVFKEKIEYALTGYTVNHILINLSSYERFYRRLVELKTIT